MPRVGSSKMMTFGSISGSGTITGPVTNNGILSPGASPGVLTVNGDVTFGSEGRMVMEIDGASPGTGYDQLVVNGNLTLDGEMDVQIIPPFLPGDGQVFTPITFTGTLTGGFTAFIGLLADNGIFLTPTIGANDYELIGGREDILSAMAASRTRFVVMSPTEMFSRANTPSMSLSRLSCSQDSVAASLLLVMIVTAPTRSR